MLPKSVKRFLKRIKPGLSLLPAVISGYYPPTGVYEQQEQAVENYDVSKGIEGKDDPNWDPSWYDLTSSPYHYSYSQEWKTYLETLNDLLEQHLTSLAYLYNNAPIGLAVEDPIDLQKHTFQGMGDFQQYLETDGTVVNREELLEMIDNSQQLMGTIELIYDVLEGTKKVLYPTSYDMENNDRWYWLNKLYENLNLESDDDDEED